MSHYGAWMKDTENETFPIMVDEPIHLVIFIHLFIQHTKMEKERRDHSRRTLGYQLIRKKRETNKPQILPSKSMCTVLGSDFNSFKHFHV